MTLGPGPVVVVCALPGELAEFAIPAGAELLACGVGPVEAASAVARRLASGPVRAVVNAGIAGAFEGRAEVGDAVAVTHETFADFGLEGGAPLVLPGDARLAATVEADVALAQMALDLGLRSVRGLTVTLVTTTDATARARRDRFAADVESMEGFAILRAAALAEVPAIELRGISNIVCERARSGWDFGAGARATCAALRQYLPSLLVR